MFEDIITTIHNSYILYKHSKNVEITFKNFIYELGINILALIN